MSSSSSLTPREKGRKGGALFRVRVRLPQDEKGRPGRGVVHKAGVEKEVDALLSFMNAKVQMKGSTPILRNRSGKKRNILLYFAGKRKGGGVRPCASMLAAGKVAQRRKKKEGKQEPPLQTYVRNAG